MSALLIIGAGLVVLAAAYYTWMVAFERREDAWQDTKHEADVLAQLAAERARNEMAERVHKLMREGRR